MIWQIVGLLLKLVMSQEEKAKILKNVLGNFYKSTDEYLFYCPKCQHHKRKLSLNIEKNVFKCWVCDYSGNNLYRLIRQYGSYKEKHSWKELTNHVDISSFSDQLFEEQIKEEDKEEAINLPEEFVSLVNKKLPYSALNAKKYLHSRGITKKDILFWKIGYCPSGKFSNRIIVPSFNLSGECNYFIGRTYIMPRRKYMNPPKSKDIIFNHLYVDFDQPINLVEGVFDAITAGPNSIPLLGSTLREESKLFQEIIKNDTPVFLALDPDAERKANLMIKKMLKYDLNIKKIDITGYEDAGEMSREEFNDRKQKASIINNQNYLLNEMIKIKI
jgi:DNA primase